MSTLDLTADQQTKIKAIFQARKDEGQALRAQMQSDRTALRAAATADTPDPTAVGQAYLKVRANRKSAAAKLTAVKADIDAVLTADQRSKLEGWIAAHRQQRRAMRGGFGDGQVN
jgi:Spy/CpxP family protein refolding chaperone